MTTMRSLAIIALLIGGTSPALAQNAPPTDGYPPPAAGAAGNPATYGPPGTGVIPGAPGPPFQSTAHHYGHSHQYIVSRSRAVLGIALTGGRKASIIGLPLAWNAGGIGVKEPASIG
jgi:hypothetical protein